MVAPRVWWRVRSSVVRESWAETWRQVKGAPCGWCLACGSIFLVVVTAALTTTLISRAPLIFLREAETSAGQIDLRLSPDPDAAAGALNYTRFAAALAGATVGTPSASTYTYHAPRLVLGGAAAWKAAQCATPAVGPDDVAARYVAGGGLDANGSVTWSPCGWFSCMPERCADARGAFDLSLTFVDTAAESRMGLGRAWPYGRLASNTAVVPDTLATKLGVRAGDELYVEVAPGDLLRYGFAPNIVDAVGWPTAAAEYGAVVMRVRIAGVVSPGVGGKAGNAAGATTLVMELPAAAESLASALHPALAALRAAAGAPSLPDVAAYATEIVANLPPATRLAAYSNSNYDRLRAQVADYASTMMYLAGFTETAAETPLLSALEPRRLITLYLGLVLNILLVILFTLSAILIYSLLLVNAESRTFDLAVRRMLGARRAGIVALLLTQASAYALPAWIIGLVGAQAAAAFVLAAFRRLSAIPVPLLLTGTGVGVGTALALVIPVVAAVGPIRGALRHTIRDALDADRPKATAIKYTLERAATGRLSGAAVIVGAVLAVFGFVLYYLLPLALLSFNLNLFFNLFLAILVAMLAGLVLAALNLELTLLRLVAALTVGWWEHRAVVGILWSNLSAGHRTRNRKTVVMYALSVAFIVFIAVAATAQIESATYSAQTRQGAPLVAVVPGGGLAPDLAVVAAVEGEARRAVATGALAATGWATVKLETALSWLATATALSAAGGATNVSTGGVYVTNVALRNAGRTARWSVSARAVSPRFYGTTASLLYPDAPAAAGATYTEFLAVGAAAPREATTLPLSTQLYTTGGSGGALLSNSMTYELQLARGRDALVQTTAQLGASTTSARASSNTTGGGIAALVSAFASSPAYSRSRLTATALLSGSPAYLFSRTPNGAADSALVGAPTLGRMLEAHTTHAAVGVPRVTTDATVRSWRAAAAALSTRVASRALAAALTGLAATTPNATAWRALRSLSPDATAAALAPMTPTGALAADAWCTAILLENALFGTATGVDVPPALAAAGVGVSVRDAPLDKLFLGAPGAASDALPASLKALKARLTAAVAAVAADRAASDGGSLIGVSAAADWSVADLVDTADDLATTVTLLNLFFAVLGLVAMVLCFFSLLASMITNIHEQQREIGVLLALGLKASPLIRVYVHEAFVLVLTSSLLGAVVGCVLAWTFGQQQSLFTSIPVPFAVPWGILAVVVIASVVCSFFAACLPARSLTLRPITSLLRGL